MADISMLLSQFDYMTLDHAEKEFRAGMVRRALAKNGGHHQRAARELGIHRNTLTRIMQEGGMELDPRGGNPASREEVQPNA